jgi:hypothetical protein
MKPRSYVSSPNCVAYKRKIEYVSNKNVIPKDLSLNSTQAIKISTATNSAFKVLPSI